MRVSIVLSTQPASFSALAYKGELAKNLARIQQLGYDGVELAVRDPALLDLGDLESLLQTIDKDTGSPEGVITLPKDVQLLPVGEPRMGKETDFTRRKTW